METKDWLKQIGLELYADSFAENGVDLDLLPELTNEDLKDLGVARLADRKMIMNAVAALSPSEESLPDEPAVPLESQQGERRQVTVLFADLSNFTKISTGLDAEETHTLLNQYFEIVDGIVMEFGGTVDKHIGDSVMALFGAPIAHTNDPERSIRAACAIHAAMLILGEKLDMTLQTHIGIASGQVIASGTGSETHRTYTVTGDTVNLASRLGDIAAAGETLISKNVHDAVPLIAAYSPRGELSVKGFDNAIETWSVRHLQDSSRSDRSGPFVGRRSELRQFEVLLDECREERQGQAILIRGDPGIGKTRLIEEFSARATAREYWVHKSLVLDFGVGKGQDAIRNLVRGLLSIPSGSGKKMRSRAAEKAVEQGVLCEDNLIFLNDLLNLPQPMALKNLYDAMDSHARDGGKRKVVAEILTARAKTEPILIVIEDIHWADQLTLDHLTTLSASMGEIPVFLVMTTRLEGKTLEQEWLASMRGAPLTTMELYPLREAEALSFAKALAAEQIADLEGIVARSEGNPLFIEQLVRNIDLGDEDQLPDTIQGLVLARTDQLKIKDREALQAASVIGQHFSLDALRAVLDDPEYEIGTLLRNRLVRPEGDALLFAHALIQEGIYSSLLKARRVALHLRAAAWFSDRDISLYAAHLDRAEDPGCAQAYLAAAQSLIQIYHFEKAQEFLRRGIEVSQTDTDRFSLRCVFGELLHDIGEIQDSIDCFQEALDLASDDVERCHAWFGLALGMRAQDHLESAMELLDKAQGVAETHQLDDRLGRIFELRGHLSFVTGKMECCLEEHQSALTYARKAGSMDLEARALGGIADAQYASGRMVTGHENCRRCIALCDDLGLGRIAVAYTPMLGLMSLYLNDLHDAVRVCKQAVTTAQRLGHQRAEILGRLILAYALNELCESESALEEVDRSAALIEVLGARIFEPEVYTHRAEALLRLGQRQEAVEQLIKAAGLCRQSQPEFFAPYTLGRLAYTTDDPSLRAGALKEGLAILEAGSVSHNHLDFHRSAMEAMLQSEAWDQVEIYAAHLETYTAAEPLPWSNFYIERGRALAAFGAGNRDEATITKLRSLTTQAQEVGLMGALPRLKDALRECP